MFPWLWFWSPHLQYPFGGNVEQDYKPFTNWGFFGAIKPEAGDGQIEQKIFDVASYGRQLGLIIEVILGLVDKKVNDEWQKMLKELKELDGLKTTERSKKLKELERSNPTLAALVRLKIIQNDIEEIKKKDEEAKIYKFETLVKELRFCGDQTYEKIIAQIRELLKDGA